MKNQIDEIIKQGLREGLGVEDYPKFKKDNPILIATIKSIVLKCIQN